MMKKRKESDMKKGRKEGKKEGDEKEWFVV